MKISEFDFCKSPKGARAIVVKLTNGSAWIIQEPEAEGAGYPFRQYFNNVSGCSEREATRTERTLLQAATDALGAYLDGEPAGRCASYGELAAIGDLADVLDWGENPPTEEEGGPAFILHDYVVNYENFS